MVPLENCGPEVVSDVAGDVAARVASGVAGKGVGNDWAWRLLP